MPRNGDGSSDNGPIDGHAIIHGTSGDETLQHTKHVAPMPEIEKGEALPGMNASGGAAAPLNDAAEEFGATAPRNEQFPSEEETSSSIGGASESGKPMSGTSSASNNKSGPPSSNSKSAGGVNRNDEFKSGHSKVDLEDVSHEKAKRYVNMNEEDVEHAGTPNSKDDKERSSQRAPKDAGPKEDIELLHGQASLDGNDKSKQSKSGSGSGNGSGNSGNSGNAQSGKQGHSGKGHAQDGEDPMRHNAEKFVNLED